MREGVEATRVPAGWVSGCLLVAVLQLAQPELTLGGLLMLFVLGTLLLLSLRLNVGFAAVIALYVVGILLRLSYAGVIESDIAEVIRAAIDQVLSGGNPYGVGYAVSTPPGGSFAYGPLALLWYLPWGDPSMADLVVSIVILGILALRGHLLGLSIYATMPILFHVAGNGSNDTSAGLLLLVALVMIDRIPRLGAFALGIAIAFKPYALAWVPPLVAWAGLSAIAPLLIGAAIFWLPAFIVWGPPSILRSFQLADAVHTTPYYSLGQVLVVVHSPLPRGVLEILRYLIGAVVALAVIVSVRSSRGVILGGTVIFLATLYTGYWATFGYVAAIAPIICWHIDEWLGFADRRVKWRGDPVGTLMEEVDRRWPRHNRSRLVT